MQKEAFLKYIKNQKNYSSHTVESYACDIEQFVKFCIGNNYILENEELPNNFKIIREWLALLNQNKIKARTINRKISAIKQYYRYLQREEIIQNTEVSKISTLKTPKNIPNFIEQQKIDLIEELPIFQNDFNGVRDNLIIETLYCTGIRRAELLTIKLSDVSIYESTLKVLGKRNKERIIPYPESLNKLIKKYLEFRKDIITDSKELFINETGKSLYPNFINRKVKYYLSYVTTNENKNPHILRHSYATHLLNNGADINSIKTLLGHENLSATQIYTHTNFKQLNKIYKQAHPRA